MDNNNKRRQNVPLNWVNQKVRNSNRDLVENKNSSKTRTKNIDNVKIRNEGINAVEQSGNSDVDIQIDVHVDTTPIAFAILCSLLATNQMNSFEFEEAVERLQNLSPSEDFIYPLNPPVNTPLLDNKKNGKRVD